MSSTAAVPLELPLHNASFVEAIKRFFSKYATFTGRASASEYWWAVAFHAVGIVVLYVPIVVISVATSGSMSNGGTAPLPVLIPLAVLMFLFGLGTIVPAYAVLARRLHDANFSGLFLLIGFVPLGSVALIVMACLPSNPEGARFDMTAYDKATAPRATFRVALAKFFANYARFAGRSSQFEYWWIVAVLIAGSFVLSVVLYIGLGGETSAPPSAAASVTAARYATIVFTISGVIGAALITPAMALIARRLHDANHSGWWAPLALVPYLGAVAVIVIGALPSRVEGERFDR